MEKRKLVLDSDLQGKRGRGWRNEEMKELRVEKRFGLEWERLGDDGFSQIVSHRVKES